MFAILLLFFVITPLFSGNSPKQILAVRTEESIKIDGILSESAWEKASSVSDFIQLEPIEGNNPSERTEVKILYDDGAIYFAFILYDSEPNEIVARLTRRDRDIESDKISFLLDTFHDHLNAYYFSVNASGVKVDAIISGDGQRFDTDWDGVWEAETNITDFGWVCEVKIPFVTLRFQSKDEQIWGINFERYISRKKELLQWVLLSKKETGRVSRSGHLIGLKNLKPPANVEFLPYFSPRFIYDPFKELSSKERSFEFGFGLDTKYKITNDIVLNATFNPDFSQVEADRVVLNLTTYETFFPEKRPFFTDGAQFFNFGVPGRGGGRRFQGMQLFYSRRIGKKPASYPDIPQGGELVYYPAQTTILSAIKLTGKTQSGISIGVLDAVTDEEKAIVRDSLGNEMKQVVEPFGNYFVLRFQKDLMENSTVGAILTNVSKRRITPSTVGGIDWDLRFLKNTYSVSGFMVFSKTRFNDGKVATAGRFSIAKIAGKNFLYSTSYDYTAKGFYINDVGFFQRDNDHGGTTELRFKHDAKPIGIVRTFTTGLRYNYRWNFDRAMIMKGIGFDQMTQFVNYWSFLTFGFISPWRVYDDRETRGNGLYLARSRYFANFQVNSDSRKPVVLQIEHGIGKWGFNDKADSVNRTERRYEFGLTLRPTDWLELEIQNVLRKVRNEEAWVENIEKDGKTISIFADRSTDEFDLTLRGTINFTRDLTLQIYSQIFVAKGHYKNFKQLLTPEMTAPYNYNGSPDFNSQTFNLNLIIRWEYKPNSVLYLVVMQSKRNGNGNYFSDLRQDLRDAFRVPGKGGIYLKLSHWFVI